MTMTDSFDLFKFLQENAEDIKGAMLALEDGEFLAKYFVEKPDLSEEAKTSVVEEVYEFCERLYGLEGIVYVVSGYEKIEAFESIDSALQKIDMCEGCLVTNARLEAYASAFCGEIPEFRDLDGNRFPAMIKSEFLIRAKEAYEKNGFISILHGWRDGVEFFDLVEKESGIDICDDFDHAMETFYDWWEDGWDSEIV